MNKNKILKIIKMSKILIIGDPHIRSEYYDVCNLFCDQIKNIILKNKDEYKFVVILGDVLHNHEKINTIALNLATNLFEFISQYLELYILVGNHDYINNSQFLTSSHWMNCLKGIYNINIIDDVKVKENKYMFCPYVPNGRFIEALETNKEYKWQDMNIIFAHQEIRSVKIFGNKKSTSGDNWHIDNPLLISGHIHQKQKLNNNVIYVGSSLPTSFSDEDDKYILEFEIDALLENYIKLDIPIRKTKYITINEFNNDYLKQNNFNKNERIIISGNANEFEYIQSEIKKIEKQGITIIKRLTTTNNEDDENKKSSASNEKNNINFYEQLKMTISKQEKSEELNVILNKIL